MININNINNTLNDMFNNAEKEYGLERIYRYDPFNTNFGVFYHYTISIMNIIFCIGIL